MRTKKGFIINEICGTHVIVAEGKENIDFTSVINLNDPALLLWNSVESKEFTIDDLADILMDNYEMEGHDPLPRDVAMKDAQLFVDMCMDAGIITK